MPRRPRAESDAMRKRGRVGERENGRFFVSPRLPVSRSPALAAAVVVVVLASSPAALAHNPDTSYARFQISRDEFSAKFTYDVTSLVRILPGLDADGDHRLTRSELQAAVP